MTDKDLLDEFLTTFNIPEYEDTRAGTMRALLDLHYRLLVLEDKLNEDYTFPHEG